jgi:hypothetical protein
LIPLMKSSSLMLSFQGNSRFMHYVIEHAHFFKCDL